MPEAPRQSPPPRRDPISFRTDLAPLGPTDSFISGATSLGIEFEPDDTRRLGLYLACLLDANTRLNLTADTDAAHAWTRHILDSLTLLPLLAELPEGSAVIDVGTGAGLPGVPLAICLPHLNFTLLEATAKKAEFLRTVCTALALNNTTVLNARAEDAAQDHRNFRECFDAAVARAVGPLSVIAELTVPLVKPETGRVLLIKGQKADDELAEAKQALHLLHAVHAGTIDTPSGRIIALEKPRKTPRAYPRPAGEPKRRPLGAQ